MRTRSRLLCVAVALALFAPGLAMGQDLPPTGMEVPQDVVIEDQPDDVKIQGDGGTQQPPDGQYEHLDMTEAWVGKETDDTFQVGVRLAKMDGPVASADWFQRASITVHFTLGEVEYQTISQTRGCSQETEPTGALRVWDPGREWFRTKVCLPLEIDESEQTIAWTIPKTEVVDRNHVSVKFDDELTSIFAETRTTVTPGTTWASWAPAQVLGNYATDRAPDTGFADAWRAVMGVVGQGHLHLTSSDPIRVSNGEATTIVYEAGVHNSADRQDTVLLSVKAPAGRQWDVRVPARLTVPPDGWVEFPVILSMPFEHDHGTTELFPVRAESTLDPKAWSTVDLGVFWTDIPQPAGHHPQMWLHSSVEEPDNPFEQGFRTAYNMMELWMNPLPVDLDPNANDAPAPSYFNRRFFSGGDAANGENVASWTFPLSPGLLIGLDFDLLLSETDESLFTTKIVSQAPTQSSVLRVELQYCDPGPTGGTQSNPCPQGRYALASGETDPRATGANTEQEYIVPLTIAPIADLLPYKRGSNLQLQVDLITDIPSTANLPSPHVELNVEDSLLNLPLIEYHDPVADQFKNVGTLSLKAVTELNKRVNPGRTTHFQFHVKNTGDQPQDLLYELEGVNLGWASILEGQGTHLLPGKTANVTLQVNAPSFAGPNEIATMAIIVQSARDPNVVALERVRATVVSLQKEDIKDEKGLYSVGEQVESPGLGLLLALAAVGGGLVALRRRP